MNIYIVSHYYDNGESYEDYREYENHWYYSTYEKAASVFWGYVVDDYEGKYVLSSVELDSQNTEKLEESAWIQCSSYWDKYYNQENPEPKEDFIDENTDFDPEHNWKHAWAEIEFEGYLSELQAEDEWMTHEGEQTKLLKEIEENKLEDELAESDKVWESLGMF